LVTRMPTPRGHRSYKDSQAYRKVMRLMELEAIRESAEPVRCVVGNPGARPGLVHAATGLAHGGCLERYVTDIALGEASAMIRLAHWMPGRLGRSLETGTALRGLPVGIDPRRVAQVRWVGRTLPHAAACSRRSHTTISRASGGRPSTGALRDRCVQRMTSPS
jgi:hypothetical protein